MVPWVVYVDTKNTLAGLAHLPVHVLGSHIGKVKKPAIWISIATRAHRGVIVASMCLVSSDIFQHDNLSQILWAFHWNNVFSFLYFSCGDSYRGTYCEYENPCRKELRRCLNGGKCNILIEEAGIDAECECPLGTYALPSSDQFGKRKMHLYATRKDRILVENKRKFHFGWSQGCLLPFVRQWWLCGWTERSVFSQIWKSSKNRTELQRKFGGDRSRHQKLSEQSSCSDCLWTESKLFFQALLERCAKYRTWTVLVPVTRVGMARLAGSSDLCPITPATVLPATEVSSELCFWVARLWWWKVVEWFVWLGGGRGPCSAFPRTTTFKSMQTIFESDKFENRITIDLPKL